MEKERRYEGGERKNRKATRGNGKSWFMAASMKGTMVVHLVSFCLSKGCSQGSEVREGTTEREKERESEVSPPDQYTFFVYLYALSIFIDR